MDNFSPIREILCEILQHSLLLMRANADDADFCFRHADHVHNLPFLIASEKPELLDFYWNIERPAFVSGASEAEIRVFVPAWEKLEAFVPHLQNTSQKLELAA